MATNTEMQISLAKVAEYVEALTRDPRSRVFVPLSEIYRQAGMLEDAQSVALKGIRQNPEYSPGYIALGRILLAREEAEKAQKAFRKAIQLDPENLSALKGLLRILWRKGDEQGAAKTAEKILKVKPGDADAEKSLQRLAGRVEGEAAGGAQAAPTRQKAEGEEPIKTATLADIYARQGLYGKALNLYRQILASDPGNEQIRRKARSAEQKLEEQGAESEPHAPARAKDESAAVEAASDARADAAESGPDPAVATIRVLEGWLESIRQRREHVQRNSAGHR